MDTGNPGVAVTRTSGELVLHVPAPGVKLFFEIDAGTLLIYEEDLSAEACARDRIELVSAYAPGTWAEVDFVGDDEE